MSTENPPAPVPAKHTRSGTFRQLLRHRAGAVALLVIAVFGVLAVLGPWLEPDDPNVGNVVDSLSAPSGAHWLGTDDLGRDVLSRVIDGAHIALVVALLSVAIALVAGLVIGVLAGYLGGFTDTVLTRSQDVLFAFPTLLLAIILVAVLGPGLINASLAIAIVYIPRFARIARSTTLQIKNSEYLDAARLAGVSPVVMVLRHVVPNVLPSVIVLAALSMSTAQLAYASLAFLGLGVSPPQADWGSMLSEARNFITSAPWMVLCPTVALVALMLAFNVLGDAIRDVLDPRSGKAGSASLPSV
ncbi:MAG TPA: ABC transporter permease [Amycolatopsis sp.]|jgi:ABC-type dipeptide/oligopeptide/nickel transport system permease subunit|nr:ABC transporter permease [Amycolatopsis sp.]